MIMNPSSNIQNQTTLISLKNAQSDLQISQTTCQIRYPIAMLLTRHPILTQQIKADFKLSQETWDHLSNPMNEMAQRDSLRKM